MLPVRLSVALLLFCLVLPQARAAIELDDYQFHHWTTEDDLPQNTIDSLCQTRDGYVWAGTPSGLARFDGFMFTVFNLVKNPEMGDETSRDLAEDTSDNSLWIATNDGLLQWKDHRFRRYTVRQGLPSNATRSVCASRHGGVWVGTSQGYGRYYQGSFTNYVASHPSITNRACVFEDSSGAVWLSTDEILLRMDPKTGQWNRLAGANQPAAGRVYQFYEGKNGRIWFGNYSGLFCWQNNEPVPIRFMPSRNLGKQHPDPDLVSQILELANGDVWAAASANGVLCLLRDREFIPLEGPEDKPIQHVSALMEDREGNIWIGTRYKGLMKLTRRQVTVYAVDNRLGDERVGTVCEFPAGTIWLGAHQGQFSTIRKGEVTSYTLPENNSRSSVQTIYPDRQGNLWFGLGGVIGDNVLWKWQDGRPVRSAIHVESKYVSALYDDGVGSFWIGTHDGVRCLRASDFSSRPVDQRLMQHKINAFFCDSDGQIWIGTDGGGLARGASGQFTFLKTNNGLSSDFVYCFYEDSDKAIWIGTRNGVNRYKNNAFAAVATEHGLPDDMVSNILEDDAQFLWLSSNRGVCRVKRSELNAAADRRLSKVRAVSFGRAEGMRSGEAPTGTQPSACKASDGRLWFATMTGVAMIDPKGVSDNTNEPPVVIERVIASDAVVFGPGTPDDTQPRPPYDFRLPPGGGRVVAIHYTANSFVAPEKVTFRYRLEGHDRNWIDCGTRRVAFYTNLRPGQYLFHVRACNNAGRWNEAGAQIYFSVAPHIYQTVPFYLGCAVVMVLAGLALHRLRLGVLTRIQRLEHANAMEKERTRIAQDMHDDLGASLTQVAILSEVAKKALHSPEKVEQHVDRISTTARSMVDTITEIIWAIGPRNDRMDSLCAFLREHAANRLEDAQIAYELDFPADVGPIPVTAEFRRNLLLVLKESLNNLLKHSGATRVVISLRVVSDRRYDRLELLVSDNGRGFDPSKKTQFHSGLANMRERVLSLGGELTIDTRQGAGTDVRASVPLSVRCRPLNINGSANRSRFGRPAVKDL